MKTGDKDADLFLWGIGLMLLFVLGVAFAGLIVLPALIIWGLYAAYKWYTKSPPATIQQLYVQHQNTTLPTENDYYDCQGTIKSLADHRGVRSCPQCALRVCLSTL